jgi:hypothetical protein
MTNDIPLAEFANQVKELTEQGFDFEDLGNFVNGDAYAFLATKDTYVYVISGKDGVKVSFETRLLGSNVAAVAPVCTWAVPTEGFDSLGCYGTSGGGSK